MTMTMTMIDDETFVKDNRWFLGGLSWKQSWVGKRKSQSGGLDEVCCPAVGSQELVLRHPFALYSGHVSASSVSEVYCLAPSTRLSVTIQLASLILFHHCYCASSVSRIGVGRQPHPTRGISTAQQNTALLDSFLYQYAVQP